MSASYEHFTILRRPMVTEKTYAATGDANQYTFRVLRSATKRQVKDAVEAAFEVQVDKVQILNMPGKVKRRGARTGFRSGYRKAVVRLAEGQTLEVAEEA